LYEADRRIEERAFGTHQQRLPQELAKAGITQMAAAYAYLHAHDLPHPPDRRAVRQGGYGLRPAPPWRTATKRTFHVL